jgi:hypothetical protein
LTHGGARNKFVVPGCEDNPEQALCPWGENQEHHEEHYRDVGGMKLAYRQFVERVKEPRSINRNGRVVVVTGPERCGKTSLINRCAHWVKTSQESQGITGFVLDLTGTCSPGMTVEQRTRLVCKGLAHKLRKLKLPEQIDNEVRPRLDDPDMLDTVFYALEDVHHHRNHEILIVLLPSLEADTEEVEISHYSRVVKPGTIIMVEYATVQAIPQQTRASSPIRLGLDYLGRGEAHRLVRRRPDGSVPTGANPEVREQELVELETFVRNSGMNIASGQLLSTLRRVYESRIDGTSQSRALHYVEYREILEAWLKLSNGAGGQGMRRP